MCLFECLARASSPYILPVHSVARSPRGSLRKLGAPHAKYHQGGCYASDKVGSEGGSSTSHPVPAFSRDGRLHHLRKMRRVCLTSQRVSWHAGRADETLRDGGRGSGGSRGGLRRKRWRWRRAQARPRGRTPTKDGARLCAGTHVTSVATDVLICARFFGDFARRQSDSICATCCVYAGTFLSSLSERFFW